MQSKQIEYNYGKTRLIGELNWDEKAGGRSPGVVLYAEAFGLNDHAREHARKLVELGYVAFCADMNGNGAVYTDMAQLGPVMQGLFADRAEWRGRARAALDALTAQSGVDSQRLAAIGFCFGGTTALELARTGAPLAAITTYHAGLVAGLPEDAGKIRARVLICHGAEDPLVKREVIDAVMEEFRRDKVDWQFIYYGNTVHSFTNRTRNDGSNPALVYSPTVAARSWAAMQHLFAEAFS
jgi:dienelactone hydrolase